MNGTAISSIILFPSATLPQGWLPCDGTIFNISDNAALFSFLGDAYGGDGNSTFGLPDLRGKSPIDNWNYIICTNGQMPGTAEAIMNQFPIASVILWPFVFAPQGWLICNGMKYSTEDHSTLFAVIGDQFGGDGQNGFCVPDLKSKVPVEATSYIICANNAMNPGR